MSGDKIQRCTECGGTILPRSIAGAERGSCWCDRGPGRVRARLYYSTDERPGGAREYDVEWEGEIIPVDPPTLAHASAVLDSMRAEWKRAHSNTETHNG